MYFYGMYVFITRVVASRVSIWGDTQILVLREEWWNYCKVLLGKFACLPHNNMVLISYFCSMVHYVRCFYIAHATWKPWCYLDTVDLRTLPVFEDWRVQPAHKPLSLRRWMSLIWFPILVRVLPALLEHLVVANSHLISSSWPRAWA